MIRFLYIVFFLFSCSVFSQTKIDFNSFNYELLEELVLKEVNNLRKAKKAPELKRDTLLGQAAQNHSAYQAKKNTMTHNQTAKDSKFVWLRVQKIGGEYSEIAENVAFSDAFGVLKFTEKGKKLTADASTYEGLAMVLFLSWKNSKPHYTAMINKKFDLTGLKFEFNTKTKRVFATQVFGRG